MFGIGAAADTKKNTESPKKDSVLLKKSASQLQQSESTMTPTKLDNCTQESGRTLPSQLNYNATQPELTGVTPPKWFTNYMQKKNEKSSTIRLSYTDSDGDEIPIESQCEFEEFLKYREHAKYCIDWYIEKYGGGTFEATGTKRNTESSKRGDSLSTKKSATQVQQSQSAKVPEKSDVVESERSELQSQLHHNETQPESFGDTAPKWFANYMKTMKDEIVTEVSARVKKTVLEALSKRRDSQYDSSTSYPHASDSEYLLDSDFDERVSLAEEEPSIYSETREKKPSDTCLRAHRYETSRRRNRHSQQRKKHIKNLDETRPSPPCSRNRNRRGLRGEKAALKKREIDEARALSQNSGRSDLNTAAKKRRDEPESPYRQSFRMTTSEPKESTFTPVDSKLVIETPILKLRLANPCNGEIAEPKMTEEELRTGYCALSDSDNISIISDVSHNSDAQRSSNSFEMIHQRSSIFTDDPEEDRAKKIARSISPAEFHKVLQEIEDPDNTRDSSSFELLSEPPASPPLSIHMDEEHFAAGKNETNDYNINDETTNDKRVNRSKIDKGPYAIDAHGKIYQQNITDGGEEENEEIVLEKRTGGSYSFVGEALPASTKESVILVGKSDSPGKNASSDVREEKDEAAEEPEEVGGNFASAFHDSTQSFHSHTAQKAENDRQDFAGFAATEAAGETSSSSHIFVDHNASKGLGDTRKTSPRKKNPEEKSSEDCRSERTRSNRKSSHDSNSSGSRNSRHDRRRFTNWSTTRTTVDHLVYNAVDPMHILPETLVTGAVHVASSAYTTARRVYDKILTAQTRKKPADRSQSKFGRR